MRGGRAGVELRLPKKEVSPHEPPAKNDRPETNVVAEGGCGGTNVEVVDLCDVTGTVCEDCGEIALISEVLPEYAEIPAAGGGPSFPLYVLALVPIAFIPFLNRDGRNVPPQFVIPNPPPPGGGTLPPTGSDVPEGPSPSPVPEPTTLLLLGSGLAALSAAARRRRIQSSASQNSGEVQS